MKNICNLKSEKRPVCVPPYFIPAGTADPPGGKAAGTCC